MEASLSACVGIVLGSHKDFLRSLDGAVNAGPVGIEVVVVGLQRAGCYHLVAKLDSLG